MKKLILLVFSSLIICSCGTSQKVVQLLKEGSTKQKDFKTIIPFEYRLGLIIVKVEIQGEQYDFLLDTGAPTTLLPELAEKLNLESIDKEKVYGINGNNKELDFVQLDEISISEIDFLNIGAAITNFNDIPALNCLNVQGLLGANLMKEAIWSFDFKKKEITIYSNKEKIDLPDNSKKANFFVGYGGIPSITTKSNGKKFLNTTVDFGYNGGVVLTSKDFTELKKRGQIISSVLGTGSSSTGIYGEKENTTVIKAIVEKYSIGEISTKNQIVDFTANYGRTLGLAFFKNNKVILNWLDKQIIMSENILFDNSQYQTFGYGTKFNDNKLIVNFLYQNSDAEKKGLKIGDQIIFLNGHDTSLLSQEEYCSFFERERLEKEVIKVKRNEQIIELILDKTTLLKSK